MKPAWRMHEERVAYRLNGKRVRGSGNGNRKGDVWVGKDWMIECKTTESGKYILNVKTLDKLAQQSLQAGLSAALVIVFHRSYVDFEMYVLVLERRLEDHHTDWKSITLTADRLRQGITLTSRYGVWVSTDFDRFMDSILD